MKEGPVGIPVTFPKLFTALTILTALMSCKPTMAPAMNQVYYEQGCATDYECCLFDSSAEPELCGEEK